MTERKPDYERGNVRLYCGDALEVLPEVCLELAAVITDPPYGIEHESHGQIFVRAKAIAGDESTEAAAKVARILSGTPLAMFYSPYKPFGIEWRSVLCWRKGAHVGIGGDRATCWKRDFELIGVRDNKELNGKRDSAVLEFNAVSPPPSGHFCEKPVPLMEYLVSKMSDEGETIGDPFMGSGSTGVACVKANRAFIGIEIDPAWFQVAVARIDRVLDQGVLF